MENWKESLIERINTKEKSKEISSKSRVIKFFEEWFEDLTSKMIGNYEITQIKNLEKDNIAFFIYDVYLNLKILENGKIEVYIPGENERLRIATITVDNEEGTYAELHQENDKKIYLSTELLDAFFKKTYSEIGLS